MTTSTTARTADTTVSLSSMLKHAVVDAKDKPIGRLEDAITRLRDDQYPLLTGLVIGLGGSRVFVPASDVISIDADRIRLRTARVDLRPFERRDGEVLLKQDVLGHRLIDVDRSALVKAYDIRLTATAEGWAVTGLDVHQNRWFQFGAHENHPARDWHAFLPLIGGQKSLRTRFALSRIRRLKPPQIADIIEGASAQEQDLLLAQVHADPELEADVFEELDEDKQARLLKTRSDRDIADVLSRMRTDDVADAVMDLPQDRRRKVLDLLPQPQNTKVLALLGYHDATAGGLMGTDYLALPEEHSIADALKKLRAATTQQPEALTTIHSLHSDGTLAGTLGLVRALQLDPATLLREVADPDTVVASPEDDIIAVTTRMADFNLLSLPVLDPSGRILGIVTVDDALEAAIPRDWSRREPGHPTPRPRPPERPQPKPDTNGSRD
ncbi:MAG: CBS domain-containing protein [Isosphaeraceae bacterium]